LLGLVNLAEPFLPLAILAGVLQFVQSKMLTPKKKGDDAAANVMSQMVYIFPVLTVFIALNLPAALPLYWSVTTLFAIMALKTYKGDVPISPNIIPKATSNPPADRVFI
jgi:YidC/Oxa1 family membrane protein insertase